MILSLDVGGGWRRVAQWMSMSCISSSVLPASAPPSQFQRPLVSAHLLSEAMMWALVKRCAGDGLPLSLPACVSRLHSMQTVLVVIQRHQQHVSMYAVTSVNALLKRTGKRGGFLEHLDARKLRLQRLMNFDAH